MTKILTPLLILFSGFIFNDNVKAAAAAVSTQVSHMWDEWGATEVGYQKYLKRCEEQKVQKIAEAARIFLGEYLR